MLSGHLQEVFLRHAGDAGIGRMGSHGHIGFFEPMVQGLGMDPKHASARRYRKSHHDQDSFRKRTKEHSK